MSARTITWPLRVLAFWGWFAGQVVQSSWQVVSDVATPGLRATPRVVRLPLRSHEDWQVTTIAALITLTPGTLTLGVVEDEAGERALLVHSMYHPDTEAALEELHDMENRMLSGLSRRPDHHGAAR